LWKPQNSRQLLSSMSEEVEFVYTFVCGMLSNMSCKQRIRNWFD